MLSFPLLLIASAAGCAATKLYVTSYGGTVTSLALDEDDFSLDISYTDTNCGSSPSWLTLDEERGILYCLDEGLETVNGSLNSYLVADDGKLAPITQLDSINGPVSGVLYGSANSRYLATAHYVGSAVSTWGAPNNGSLTRGENTTFTLAEPGPNADRQEAAHEHEAILDPSGQYVLVPDLGADLVRVFSFDKRGDLVAEEPLQAKSGSGPRHAVFWTPGGSSRYHANDTTYMFLVSELANTVTSYAVTYPASGGLAFREVALINTYGGAPIPDGATAAEIVVSPDNRFVVISNRNDSSFEIPSKKSYNMTTEFSDSLATFAIQPNGTLAFHQLWPAGGSMPRNFALNGGGDLVAVALQYSSRLVILKRDVGTGLVGDEVARVSIAGNLTCVVWDEGC